MPARFLHGLARRLAVLLLALLPALAVADPVATNPRVPLVDDWQPDTLPDGWETLRGVSVHVHGHPADGVLLARLLDHADDAVPRLAAAIGVPVGGDVHVFLTRTPSEFATLQPGTPPLWADATAYPSLGAVYLRHPDLRRGDPEPLEQVLDHEIVHVLLGRAFHPLDAPRWLQEGVAQVYAGQVGPDLPRRIQEGTLGPGLFTLADLAQGFPANPTRAGLAYAQSADFVHWFRGRYGEDAVRRLVRYTREGRSLEYAIRQITGTSLEEIDATWRARLDASFPLPGSADQLEAALFATAGLGILLVGAARRRALVRRMKAWRDHEVELRRLAREVVLLRHQHRTDGA